MLSDKTNTQPVETAPSAATRRPNWFDSWWCILALSAVFSLVMIYHYVIPLGALPFYEGIRGEDCGQMVWNLWFVDECVSHGHNPYFTDQIFYPTGANLSYHTLAAGFFPVTFVVKQLSRGDARYPLYAYRLVVWISFTLILSASYLLLRELRFPRFAAAIPALAYSFSDFFKEHVIHINHLAAFFIPLTALALVRLYKKPTLARALACAVAGACAIYFTEFALYIYMAATGFALAASLFAAERRILFERAQALGAKRAAAAFLVFALLVSPYLLALSRSAVIKPGRDEAARYSADVAAFFIPNHEQTWLYGRAFASLESRIAQHMGERGTFVGFPLILFGLLAAITSRRKFLRLATLMSLGFFLLSLGPALKIFGTDTRLPLPYALLMQAPPFDWSRTPVRFVVMGMFFLMIIAAQGLRWTTQIISEKWQAKWVAGGAGLILVWTILESASLLPRQQAFIVPAVIKEMPAGPALNLPLRRNDGYATLLQVFHHQPIATGYVARVSLNEEKQIRSLEELVVRGGWQFCEGIRAFGLRNIVIAPQTIASNAPSVAPLELAQCPVNVIDLRRGKVFPSVAGAANHFEAEGPAQFPLWKFGAQVDFATEDSDQYVWYGWSGREPAFRWTNGNKATLVFSVAEPRDAILRIDLVPFLVAGKLTTQRLNVTLNQTEVAALRLDEPERIYSINLPSNAMRQKNILTLELPDAASPASFDLSDDRRLLGVSARWIQLDTARAEQRSLPRQ